MAGIELPYGVIASLKNKLNSSAYLDLGRIYGITDEIKKLMTCILHIEPVLPDAEDHAENNSKLKNWIRELKDALHAADDFFDDIATENLRLKSQYGSTWKVHSFFSCTNGIVFPLRISNELRHIQRNFDVIEETLFTFNLVQRSESKRRVTTPSYYEGCIFGRSKDKEQILRILMELHENENVSSIGIVGVGGVGKTTVAQMLFNDGIVATLFDVRIWVYVSENFVVETIIKEILKSLNFESNGEESFIDLVNILERALKHRRYLLVLDDVWNEDSEKWTQLMTHLMCGAQGSKILVTTRSEIVANHVIRVHILYQLQGLHDSEAWVLLMQLVFVNDDYQMNSDRLQAVGREIVNKCRGVPQLIRIVAILLRGKYKESEWVDVLEGDFWNLDEEQHLMHDLKLSYQHLLPQLKQCFLYCSVYPKGWKIEKNELIQLWMAQGYLEGLDDNQQMEDMGNIYVYTLLRNSFFQQDEKVDDDDNLDAFKMHDLMYDLAMVVAGNDYYLDSERANKSIHICFSREFNNINLLGSLDASKLRTFFLQRANDHEIAHMKEELSVILRFKRLRVLNLSHSTLKKLPGLIGKLKNLRYLDLSWCVKLVSLHKCICNLINLQTLKLTGCEKLEFSTKFVTKLINLRHLEIDRCKAFENMMPAGLGKLSSLQSLSNFYVVDDKKKKAGKLHELQNLNNLRGNLQISTLDQVRDVRLETQDVNLKDKKLIESLDLNWENQDNVENSFQLLENLCPHQNLKRLHVRWYPGDKFPKWLSSINNLSHISLFGFDNCESLPPIENLPNLKSLEIGSMKVLKYIYFEAVSSTAATFFRSLERLKFSGCVNFKGWERLEGEEVSVDNLLLPQFPCLSQLIINKCPKLTELPTFPIVEKLQLSESSVKPLKETLDMASSSFFTPLSMLKSLKIEGKLPDIKVLPSQWKQNLTSLQCLEIGDVDNLDIWFDHNFPSLEKVVVYGCDLKDLPSRMCDLLSLQHIKMMGCHKLASLPEKMDRLAKLVKLEIWDCPLLVERYQKETGVDWPQISKVPIKILK